MRDVVASFVLALGEFVREQNSDGLGVSIMNWLTLAWIACAFPLTGFAFYLLVSGL